MGVVSMLASLRDGMP